MSYDVYNIIATGESVYIFIIMFILRINNF